MHDVMASSTQEWRRERRHRQGEGRLKAYLLDAHASSDDDQSSILALLQRACELQPGASVEETHDALLFMIYLDNEFLVVDAAEPRFMIVHTAGRAENTDRFITAATDALPDLDCAWLPSAFLLNSATTIGRLRRGTVRYDNSQLLGQVSAFEAFPDEIDNEDDVIDDRDGRARGKRLTLDLADPRGARQALEELSELDYFRHALALSRVDLLHRDPDSGGEMYSVSRVFDWGKVSAVGTSADSHLAVLFALRHRYQTSIERIEREFAIYVDQDGQDRGRFHGQPISIRFQVPIDDIGQFARRLFSSRRPFSLWGEPRMRSNNYVTVHGLDLHIGAPIYCEIMPDAIRVYLQRGTCGNTVARLYTNLVRHYDASATLYGRGAEDALLQ